jgi:glutathionylspermidine synthase
MRRIASQPRANWQKKVEDVGLTWHSGDVLYWNEFAFYELTTREVELLAAATNQLESMTREAAQHVIDNRLYARMGIPESAVPLIERSWDAEQPSLYGRFDFAFDGRNPPKLLEYNADTPTSLLEAAVVQWYWLQETHPDRDQFNSVHERLLALWKELAPFIPRRHVDFCSMEDAEDVMTVAYLLDTAQQAGLTATSFQVGEIGWDGNNFVRPDDQPLGATFKLYPWEWMMREEFGSHLTESDGTIWIEPPWKMLLSNKGILPILWELYRGHPNLLEASFDGPGRMECWVKKPLLGREGANITLHYPHGHLEMDGDYGEEGYTYQEFAALETFDGRYPVIGSWVIGHEEGNATGGIGIRESDTPITTNMSQFVPHLFD